MDVVDMSLKRALVFEGLVYTYCVRTDSAQ